MVDVEKLKTILHDMTDVSGQLNEICQDHEIRLAALELVVKNLRDRLEALEQA